MLRVRKGTGFRGFNGVSCFWGSESRIPDAVRVAALRSYGYMWLLVTGVFGCMI